MNILALLVLSVVTKRSKQRIQLMMFTSKLLLALSFSIAVPLQSLMISLLLLSSKVQARMAFSSYLQRVQQRLLVESRANTIPAWPDKDSDQMV